MEEKFIVKQIVDGLHSEGYFVATEIANLYRSADIAVYNDKNEEVWVIECKNTCISKAIKQSRTHKLSADKVYIGTPFRKTRSVTLDKIREAGVGLFYVMGDGRIELAMEASDNASPWDPAREKLKSRILASVK
ncbi:hypothetical protein ACFL37_02200 [Candidatus Margulisiibacteriota bacterium]